MATQNETRPSSNTQTLQRLGMDGVYMNMNMNMNTAFDNYAMSLLIFVVAVVDV